MNSKVCVRCKVEKPTDSFHPHKKTLDGLNSWCKDCYKEYRSARQAAHGERNTANVRAWRAHNNGAGAAHAAVSRTGVSVSDYACAVCGAVAVDWHHWSYEKQHRLSVVPLCRSCHVRHHDGLLNIDASLAVNLTFPTQ